MKSPVFTGKRQLYWARPVTLQLPLENIPESSYIEFILTCTPTNTNTAATTSSAAYETRAVYPLDMLALTSTPAQTITFTDSPVQSTNPQESTRSTLVGGRPKANLTPGAGAVLEVLKEVQLSFSISLSKQFY